MQYAASESLYEAFLSNSLAQLDAFGLIPSKLRPWSCCATSEQGLSTAHLTQSIQVGPDNYIVEWRLSNNLLKETMSGGIGTYGGSSACTHCNWSTLVDRHIEYRVLSNNNPCSGVIGWEVVKCPGSTIAHTECRHAASCYNNTCCLFQNSLYAQWHGDACPNPIGVMNGCNGSSSPAWPKWKGAGTTGCNGSSRCYKEPDAVFTTTLACPGSLAQTWSVEGAPIGGSLKFAVTWTFECPKQ